MRSFTDLLSLSYYARKHPDKVAIKCHADSGSTSITYDQLYQMVNNYADKLEQQGAGSHVRVVLYVNQSIESIAWLLAIFKTGAIYVPVDPNNQERMKLIIDEVNPALIIHDGEIHKRSNSISRIEHSGAQQSEPYKLRTKRKRDSDEDESIAYIMYTSGTTGRPKGVMNSYRVVKRLLTNVGQMGMRADDQMLQLAPLSFDASYQEIFQALANGSTLHKLPKSESYDVQAIRNLISRERISVLVTLPGIASGLSITKDTSLRDMTVMGELAPSDLQKLCEFVEIVRSEWGTTETCVRTTTHTIGEGFKPGNIGKPVDGAHFIILKELNEQPGKFMRCKLGEKGTLFVRGDVLASGYLNNPQLTKQKFPYLAHVRGDIFIKSEDGVMFYDTGDLAKKNYGGDYHWLGRADREVKISGSRINLDTVEAALNELPVFEKVRVLPRANAEGQVVAMDVYYQSQQELTQEALNTVKSFSKELRQITLFPPRFIHHGPKLPLTTNGKIDDAVLKTKSHAHNSACESDCERKNEPNVKYKIMKIWKDHLGLESINLVDNDNFINLGGTSLLHRSMINKVKEAFDLNELASPIDATMSALEQLVKKQLAKERASPVFWANREITNISYEPPQPSLLVRHPSS